MGGDLALLRVLLALVLAAVLLSAERSHAGPPGTVFPLFLPLFVPFLPAAAADTGSHVKKAFVK